MSSATQIPRRVLVPQPGTEAADTLPDRLCAMLADEGGTLDVESIATRLLKLRHCPSHLQHRLVSQIVAGDPRLRLVDEDRVGLAPGGWVGATLRDARYCVVDLETTGGSPGTSRVTEIGAVLVRGLRIEERFGVLVDPGVPIPPVVTDLTGIDDALVAGRPGIEDALGAFAEFAGDAVLVAHNAPFDLRFLNYERRRLTGRYFTQPWLDTLTLARRLLEGRATGHDLGTLAEWLGTAVRPIHRALPDAEATAELLVALIGMLAERGIETLDEAISFSGAGGARHFHKLALAEELPSRPGVFVMRDRDGGALHVGTAANLRRRVRSYFLPGSRHGRLVGGALERLDAIDHEVWGSEFGAALRELRLLRELRPPADRSRSGGAGRFLKLGGEPFPRLYVVSRALRDGAAYFGPVRSERLARQAVECLHLLLPLSDPDPVERAGAVAEVHGLLDGDPGALGRTGARLAAAVRDGALGSRPAGEDLTAALLATLAGLARARRARDRTAVVVEPGSAEGDADAFFVRAGVVSHHVRLPASGWRAPAREGLAALRVGRTRGAPMDAGVLDEATLVAERLGSRSDGRGVVRLEPGWRDEDALAAIGRALADLGPPAEAASP
ncbi:MAG: exonuclease domain-containing protein [Thermoleophilia bacterium]